MIPMKLTIENVKGTDKSWGQSAAEGLCERDAKSGALLLENMSHDKSMTESRRY